MEGAIGCVGAKGSIVLVGLEKIGGSVGIRADVVGGSGDKGAPVGSGSLGGSEGTDGAVISIGSVGALDDTGVPGDPVAFVGPKGNTESPDSPDGSDGTVIFVGPLGGLDHPGLPGDGPGEIELVTGCPYGGVSFEGNLVPDMDIEREKDKESSRVLR